MAKDSRDSITSQQSYLYLVLKDIAGLGVRLVDGSFAWELTLDITVETKRTLNIDSTVPRLNNYKKIL